MFKITSDERLFFEKSSGDIIRISAGNSAYWVSYYLKKLNIPVACFVDSTAKQEGELFNGYPIYHDSVIDKYINGGVVSNYHT